MSCIKVLLEELKDEKLKRKRLEQCLEEQLKANTKLARGRAGHNSRCSSEADKHERRKRKGAVLIWQLLHCFGYREPFKRSLGTLGERGDSKPPNIPKPLQSLGILHI